MTYRIYTLVFAVTLLISAALLFSIQPMFSKMILPLLGGTPHVWNTAMLFFQVILLLGYAYAHGTSRYLSVKAQSIVHIILLIIFFFVLPFGIGEDIRPPADSDPTFWQLSLMAATIGGPFFVLSGCAPMFQRWFANTDHPDANNPYFLYGASNLGSMLSLLAYPFFIEPYLNLDKQAWTWMMGYSALILFALITAGMAWSASRKQAAGPAVGSKFFNHDAIEWRTRGKWLLLSFLPSSLMLGVTTYVTTDIASVPLLWIIPLAMYVGTFIIVFSRKEILSKDSIFVVQGVLIAMLITKTLAFYNIEPLYFVGLHFVLFFFCALACHKELADSKPEASHLTEFYLIMSIGGALGGVFNALIAPQIFLIPLEYTLVLVTIAFLRYGHKENESFANFKNSCRNYLQNLASNDAINIHVVVVAIVLALSVVSIKVENFTHSFTAAFLFVSLFLIVKTRWTLAICLLIVMVMHPPGYKWNYIFNNNLNYIDRNFFGVLRVMDDEDNERVLIHGTTNHGTQPLIEEYRLTPLSYYGYTSPLRDAFEYIEQKDGEQNVAILGLGIGVTACFQKDGRSFDFYEIDADVAKIAENQDLFTYLSDCGSPYEIILGDGRLTVKDKPNDYYDLILLDAFSSDNVPVHLLTIEAIKIYLSKLKPDGILVFNISNNYLDLEPVLADAAQELNLKSFARIGDAQKIEGTELSTYIAHFFAILPEESTAQQVLLENKWSAGMFRDNVRYWSDQYSNVVSVLGTVTARKRFAVVRGAKEENAPNEQPQLDPQQEPSQEE